MVKDDIRASNMKPGGKNGYKAEAPLLIQSDLKFQIRRKS